MGLKKFLKKAKKTLKKAVNANPLVPGSHAQKKLSNAAKKGIPLVAAVGGPSAVGAAQAALLGNAPGALGGGFFDDLSGALKKARDIADALNGGNGNAAAPLPQEAPAPKGISPTLVMGGLAVVAVVLLARKA